MRKHVVSTEATPERVVDRDALIHESRRLADILIRHGLVDERRVWILPARGRGSGPRRA